MKKMLFIQHWSTIGGSGISLYNTCLALNSQYDLTVFLPEYPNDLSLFLIEKGIKVKTVKKKIGQISYYSGYQSTLKIGFWIDFFRGFLQLPFWKSVLNEESPDIVLVNSKVLCYLSLVLKDVKSICFVRETIPVKKNAFLEFITRNLLERFTAVSFLSEYDRKQTNLKMTKSILAYDFLNISDYKTEPNISEISENLNIAFFGGNDYLKGFHQIMLAAMNLKNEKVRFHVVGYIQKASNLKTKLMSVISEERWIINNHEQFIQKHQLQDMFKFYGKMEDISPVMNACDLVLFPMIMPHQSRPAFEAGAFKKTVLIPNFDNIKEFYLDKHNAILFEPNSVVSLVDKIQYCIDNRNELKDLGIKNFENTVKYHLEETALNELRGALDEIFYE